MTPGDHTARRLALTDARLVPLEWLTVVQVLDTECPPRPQGRIKLVPLDPDGEPWAIDPDLYRRIHRPAITGRLTRRRRMDRVGRLAWWLAERVPAAIAITLAVLLAYAILRQTAP